MKTRRQLALDTRHSAADAAATRPHPRHVDNAEEFKFRHNTNNMPSYLTRFTKGLAHDEQTGLVQEPEDFVAFVRGIDSGDPVDFARTPLGPNRAVGTPLGALSRDASDNARFDAPVAWRSPAAQSGETQNGKKQKGKPVRAWESSGTGLTFDLQGPDAQSVTMPPAPRLGTPELVAEMAEVYVQALLRDVPFSELQAKPKGGTTAQRDAVKTHIGLLNELDWFSGGSIERLTVAETARRRTSLTTGTAFRGIAPGDDVGPYLSQFLLVGNERLGAAAEGGASAGEVQYGAQVISSQVRVATPGKDYMTDWASWLDVQDGADLRGTETYLAKPSFRFIATPRDLATYVHYDALYQAYLNACLLLLSRGAAFDPGIPYRQRDGIDHQQGFAAFGGPHILSLVTEVATRALKAVRFQKFNVHRRLRPEALAARIDRADAICARVHVPELEAHVVGGSKKASKAYAVILANIAERNAGQNGGTKNHLLPMAFPEGSPMHPAYGAGHATVAGACVTILKAWFDHGSRLDGVLTDAVGKAYVAKADGSALDRVAITDSKGKPSCLTVEGELNKLAANIAIGRDWAGVHFFTDYIESLKMGEQIALGILEEQKLTYGENFSMTVPLFDGTAVRI